MNFLKNQYQEIIETKNKTTFLKHLTFANLGNLFMVLVYGYIIYYAISSAIAVYLLIMNGSTIGHLSFFIGYYSILVILTLIMLLKRRTHQYKIIILALLMIQFLY